MEMNQISEKRNTRKQNGVADLVSIELKSRNKKSFHVDRPKCWKERAGPVLRDLNRQKIVIIPHFPSFDFKSSML
jgi:hypothetical protein